MVTLVKMDSPSGLPKGKTYSPMSMPAGVSDVEALSKVEEWMNYRGTPKATVYWFDRGNRGRLYYTEA